MNTYCLLEKLETSNCSIFCNPIWGGRGVINSHSMGGKMHVFFSELGGRLREYF